MDEKQTLEDVTPEALEAQKQQKSRNRIFGLFVIIDNFSLRNHYACYASKIIIQD